jgi:hypothetical protein
VVTSSSGFENYGVCISWAYVAPWPGCISVSCSRRLIMRATMITTAHITTIPPITPPSVAPISVCEDRGEGAVGELTVLDNDDVEGVVVTKRGDMYLLGETS